MVNVSGLVYVPLDLFCVDTMYTADTHNLKTGMSYDCIHHFLTSI